MSEGKIAIEQAKEQLSTGEESLSCWHCRQPERQAQMMQRGKSCLKKEETLESGENTLQEQEQTLIKSREEYETAKAEAQAKIEEGEQKTKMPRRRLQR